MTNSSTTDKLDPKCKNNQGKAVVLAAKKGDQTSIATTKLKLAET